jgi:MoaA/NifB/PqqE/SkfB family radical SAM enzyme
MFSFNQLHTVQIEITNRCQASCPMCLRNIHGGIDNPNLISTDWSLEQFQKVFTNNVLSQISCVNFCGDFGDPIINANLIDMCRYVRDKNPNVIVLIYTNGSAHTTKWWESLATALPENHKIIFALDGLKDTHSLYRIGTSYEMIIKNARAFIDAGGIAEWMFIRFKHNEHEVETARAIAKELGFTTFNTKDSKRFGKNFPVLDKQGNIEYYIEPPTTSKVKPVEFLDLKDYKEWKTDISCFTVNGKELYIDANGYLMPCCIMGSFLYANYDVELYRKYGVIDETSITSIAREVQLEVFSIIQELGGLDALDSKKHSIEEIMATNVCQKLIHHKWDNHSSSACKILCGNNGPFIKISEQVNRTV